MALGPCTIIFGHLVPQGIWDEVPEIIVDADGL